MTVGTMIAVGVCLGIVGVVGLIMFLTSRS